ncbi:MAG: complex I NDUFA9 subunit family protein [Alphaproteobacteria bacterium]|nr:complex I NDUFA9 subunit family protein [Alphaproteobacteria bacterium]
MAKNYKTATVFGGTGFVGTQIVRELAKRDIVVKIATRVPERGYFLKPCGAVGQIVPVQCDYSDAQSVAAAIEGSDYVINCIGILFEKGGQTFERAHVEIPSAIALACGEKGVSSFIHISALGVERSESEYAKSKVKGEAAIKAAFPRAVILRPSVIFGEDDEFFNMFASLAKFLPVLPLINGGETLFQPVYVGDVADAAIAAMDQSAAQGNTYELGGPETLSFKGVYEKMFEYTGQKRILFPLPNGLAKIQATFMSILPKPPITKDQIESLKTDNVMNDGALGLADLGVNPTSLDIILPTYLTRYRRGGRFGDKMSA